jgi:hypothetical protein
MEPNVSISRQLKKATDTLQNAMLVKQEAEKQIMVMKKAFLSETDPTRKERIKPKLIKLNRELKAAEQALAVADANFHRLLATEPDEDIYDLLDHKIQEYIVRKQVRKVVTETLKKLRK